MTTSVLITGASGLVGTRLTEILIQKGYQVSHLGRSKRPGSIPSFVWNVEQAYMDPAALKGVDTIINLAGTGVAEKRWTEKRKKEIHDSRTQACKLIYDALKSVPHHVRTFVSASAIGYYGYNLHTNLLDESTPPGADFLAQVVVDWEKAIDELAQLNLRTVKLRIGIVLSEKGGALVEMGGPVKYGIGSPLASGRQMLSWIHLDDLCGIIIKAVEDQGMHGAYNAVAPNPVSNRDMTKAIGKFLNRPVIMPNVPEFVLQMVVGEMAAIVINGAAISGEKILKAGYSFQFTQLEDALRNLYAR